MTDQIDTMQEKAMAPRKTTANTDRNEARKTPAGDQAGLVALTTTLLAGAVTGAVARLVETGDTRHVLHASGTPSPDEAIGLHNRIEPEQARHDLAASTEVGQMQALRPAEADRTEALQVTHAGPLASPHIQDAPHQPPAGAGAAGPAGSQSVSIVGEDIGEIARAPAAEMAAQNSAATASGGGVADQPGNVVSSIDLIGTHHTGSFFDNISGRLDHAVAAINDGLTASFAAIDTGQADVARTLGEVHAALDSKFDAAVELIDGQVSHVAHTIDNIEASLTDVFAENSIVTIPATVLGAEQDDQQPNGLLAKLFDTAAVLPSSEAGPAHMHDMPVAIVQSAAPDHANLPIFSTDYQIPELTSAIDSLKIGFAGQPFAEASDGHDGAAGSHANLLHGLL